jgi:hypothetical protein
MIGIYVNPNPIVHLYTTSSAYSIHIQAECYSPKS